MLYCMTDTPKEILTPCSPSPCGSNAICREQNGVGACRCIDEYFGNPYESCRPECIINSDCPSNRACIKNKCQDNCPGTCGQNADCQVINHLPSCSCRIGFSGDPYRICNLIPNDRKIIKLKEFTNLKYAIHTNLPSILK